MSNARLAPFTLPPRYHLERPIAAGGMAAVYSAHDTLLDRPVAVKVLAEHLNEDADARRRFQREARAAAGLSSHPSVVTIYDVGEHAGRSFIVMERRDGGTIGDVMARGRIAPQRALGWLRDAAAAIDAAHDRGVVHRDIKPANLLLDDHDRVAVADFGIARLAFEDKVTATGQVLGTAAYISPEQATGQPATAASDRYALAVVAFELLAGRKPFEGEHFAAQARAHIEDPPPRASQLAPHLPPAVDDVLARGLAKDPAARWPSATAFVDALDRALSAPPTATTRRVPPPPPAVAAGAAAAAPPPRRRGTPKGTIAAVAVLLAIALIALIAALSNGGGKSSSGRHTPTPTPARKHHKATPTPTATATATAAETATASPAATGTPRPAPTASSPASTDPAALNNKGYALYQKGNYAGAIPYFRKAVQACGGSTAVSPCAYATFNLGSSVYRAGQPAQAIPILQGELKRWPSNQPDVVRRELAAACQAAGQDCGPAPNGGPGKNKGKGNGKAKGKKD